MVRSNIVVDLVDWRDDVVDMRLEGLLLDNRLGRCQHV